MTKKEQREFIFNKYKCIHCGEIVTRESSKQWIKSYCDKTDRYVRLQLIKD